MRKEIKGLENHACFETKIADSAAVGSTFALRFDHNASYLNFSVVRLLQKINATQQRAFAGTTGTDDAAHFGGIDFERQVFEDMKMAEIFLQMRNSNNGGHVRSPFAKYASIRD